MKCSGKIGLRIMLVFLLLIVVWVVLLSVAKAQSFSGTPQEFPEQLRQRLQRLKSPGATAFVDTVPDKLKALITDEAEQIRYITQVNTLLTKGWSLYPEVGLYLSTLITISNTTGGLSLERKPYYDLVDSCLKYLSKAQVIETLHWVTTFAKTGLIYGTPKAGWKAKTVEGTRLFFGVRKDENFNLIATPVIELPQTDLIYNEGTKSTTIVQTTGFYEFIPRKMFAHGGKYSWARLGADDLVASLSSFTIDFQQNMFVADSTLLALPSLTPEPLIGRLTEKMVFEKDSLKSDYPMFVAERQTIRLDNLYPNVSYEGGFTLKGLKQYGTATRKFPATLFIGRNDSAFVVRFRTSELYLNPPKPPLAAFGHVTVFLPEGDTLAHPSIQLYYSYPDQKLTLTRNDKVATSKQPFIHSRLASDLYIETLVWPMAQDTMRLTTPLDRAHKVMAIQSKDYYNLQRFDYYSKLLPYNPIGIIYNYYVEVQKSKLKRAAKAARDREIEEIIRKKKRDESGTSADDELAEESTDPSLEEEDEGIRTRFSVHEILAYYKQKSTEAAFIKVLPQLESQGFIRYEPENRIITILPYLIKQAEAARGTRDSDALRIPSYTSSGPNGFYNYRTGELILRGVDDFGFSDSQYVHIQPKDRQVFMTKNRDLRATGTLKAGMLNLVGRDSTYFNFSYKDFAITTDTLKYLSFSPRRSASYDPKKHSPQLIRALSNLRIEKITGTVYINKPNNKNGRKPLRHYSAFDAHNPGYVYWSNKLVQNGVYHRDSLYFNVEPFILTNLEKIKFENLALLGEFYCANIMPGFQDTLKLIDNKSYGLHETMPDTGVALYGGKGRFFNRITMDVLGLHGKGRILYLSTVAKSDTFIFHFDSVMAKLKAFYVPEGAYKGVFYPEIKTDKATYKWYPKADRLVVETTSPGQFSLYQGGAYFTGKLTISPQGVYGSGTLSVGLEQYESDSIAMNNETFFMEKGTFSVIDEGFEKKHHFNGKQIRAERNMKTQLTKFTAQDGSESGFTFPRQKFLTTLAEGGFDRANNRISLSAKPEGDNYFRSTDSSAHGLRFNARFTIYKMNEERIDVLGVDSIRVADAIVFPPDSQVTILPDGRLQRMEHANLTFHRTGRRFENATVKVLSGIDLIAKGNLVYPISNRPQYVPFDSLYVRAKDTVTIGVGFIPEDKVFYLAPRIIFKDSVRFNGKQRYLDFKGQVRLQTNNPALKDVWFDVNERNLNPDSVFLKLDPKLFEELGVGLFFPRESPDFYTVFLEKKRNPDDRPVSSSTGRITFDNTSKEFRIGPERKLKKLQFKGTVTSYNDSTGIKSVRGVLNLPFHVPRERHFFPMQWAGLWRENPATGGINVNALIALDFPSNLKPLFEAYAAKLKDYEFSEGDVTNLVEDRLLHELMAEFIDKNDGTEAKTRKIVASLPKIASYNDIPIAGALGHYLDLANVQFAYCDTSYGGYEGLFYAEKPINLLGVMGKPIYKKVGAKILYLHGGFNARGTFDKDKMQIYLEINEQEYVFMEFSENWFKAYSTNGEFNRILGLEAERTKKKRGDKRELQVELLGWDDVDKFKAQFTGIMISGCGKK